MNPYERHLALLSGEEPDKVDIIAAEGLRTGPLGGWLRRLSGRGMGITHIVPPYKPMFFYDNWINPEIKEIIYTQSHYIEKGIRKIRHGFETSVGNVFSIVGRNPDNLITNSPEIPFVKNRSDWCIVNYIFEKMIENMRPNYEEMFLDQDTLGMNGTTIAVVDKTPFQRSWIELASLEQTVFDSLEKPDEFLEYIDVQTRFHEKAAEITAGCPAMQINIIDNITNTISPKLYEEYCLPIYKIYAQKLAGTGKCLAIHFDGYFKHLRKAITNSPFQVIDSFTVPPIGNVSLSEAKELWPDKIPFINLAPHLAFADKKELHEGYEKILAEWGNKKIAIEHVEDLPQDRLEMHLSAVMDVCGY